MAILVAAFPLLIIRLRVVGRAFQGDRLLLILLAFIVISCSWSISPLRSVALASVLCFTTTMAVYIGVRFTLGEIKGAVICSLCLIMVGTVLFTVVSPGNAFMQDGHAGALRGFYSQKNTLARSMALAVPLIFSSLVAAKQLPKRLVLLGLFAMAVLLLLATRSATGALVAGGLLMAHPMTSLFKARRYLAASALILVLSLIAIGTVSLVRNVENVSVALGRDPTLTGRTIVWTIAIRDIAARPLV